MSKKVTRRVQKIPDEETKAARFIRVVTPRVNKAVKSIQVVGFCNGSSYEHTPAQAAQICDLLHKYVDGLSRTFSGNPDSGGSFKLDS